MGTMGVDVLRDSIVPQRDYLWDMLVPAPPGGGESDVLNVRCQSSSLPGRSVGSIHIPYKQSAGIKVPGKLTYSHTWDCVFVEGEDKKVFEAIYAWLQAVIDDYDGVGDGDNEIKADVYLTLQATKGSITRKIKLVGCYPESLADVGVDYASEGTVRYSVTFSYDRWEDVA